MDELVNCNPAKTCLIPRENFKSKKGTVVSLNDHTPTGGWTDCGGIGSGCFDIGHGHGCCNKKGYNYKCVGDGESNNQPFRCQQNA